MSFLVCEDGSDDEFFKFSRPSTTRLSLKIPRSAPDLQSLTLQTPSPTGQWSVPSTSRPTGPYTMNPWISGWELSQSTLPHPGETQKPKPSKKRNIKRVSRTRTVGTPAERYDFDVEYFPHHQQDCNISDIATDNPTTSTSPLSDEDTALQRLRNFSVRSKRVINRGDSFRFKEELPLKSPEFPEPECPTPVMSETPDTSSKTNIPTSPKSHENIKYSVLVLGCSAVGKSTLTNQFKTSEYICDYDSTQDEGDEKLVTVILNGDEFELLFIEQTIPENETETNLTLLVENADAYVVVYSVAHRESFQLAKTIIKHIKKLQDMEKKAVILAGNKTDLARLRTVSTDAGRDLATSQNCKFIETSAGINHHVDELLVGILSQIRLKYSQSDRSGKKRCSVSLDKIIGLSFSTVSSLRSKDRIKQFFQKKCRRSKSCANLHVM
ncbi:GTP-binding protein REM 1-like [Limulus polyphemus]|uniref:GTP-binding protein REM 1-like n=1 Tax=Limulus polyphemus TaxID=6850 RepID=A0ABM1B5X9_LIMPO|nr:GTP-binding protein REM 1-like [Limulus polyphemus]